MKDRASSGDENVGVWRYVLTQDFMAKPGETESHRTAVVSVIGLDPGKEFECQLAKLDFAEGRFKTVAHGGVNGCWTTKRSRRIPECCNGLIFLAHASTVVLDEFESEIEKYWAAGAFPLVACLASKRFENLVRRRLADYEFDWCFVQYQHASAIPEKPYTLAIKFVEALLLGATYPGLICLDTADTRSVFLGGDRLRVFEFSSDSITALAQQVRASSREVPRARAILATIFGPQSMKSIHMDELVSQIQSISPENSTTIFAALADSTRDDFCIFLVCNDGF